MTRDFWFGIEKVAAHTGGARLPTELKAQCSVCKAPYAERGSVVWYCPGGEYDYPTLECDCGHVEVLSSSRESKWIWTDRSVCTTAVPGTIEGDVVQCESRRVCAHCWKCRKHCRCA